jgi:hypothetical protein
VGVVFFLAAETKILVTFKRVSNKKTSNIQKGKNSPLKHFLNASVDVQFTMASISVTRLP